MSVQVSIHLTENSVIRENAPTLHAYNFVDDDGKKFSSLSIDYGNDYGGSFSIFLKRDLAFKVKEIIEENLNSD